MEYIARKSNHIQEDIKRNWSSWNFGEEGFKGTREELEISMQKAIDNDSSFWISGFDLWENEIKNADIRELYNDYWVLVDNVNAKGFLSCLQLDSETLEDAINEINNQQFNGDGQYFDSNNFDLVKSEGDIHIFVRNSI